MKLVDELIEKDMKFALCRYYKNKCLQVNLLSGFKEYSGSIIAFSDSEEELELFIKENDSKIDAFLVIVKTCDLGLFSNINVRIKPNFNNLNDFTIRGGLSD